MRIEAWEVRSWLVENFEAWRRLCFADCVALVSARFRISMGEASAQVLQAVAEIVERRRDDLRAAELLRIRGEFVARGLGVRGIDRKLIDLGRTRSISAVFRG